MWKSELEVPFAVGGRKIFRLDNVRNNEHILLKPGKLHATSSFKKILRGVRGFIEFAVF